jgi:HAD superfamily hydrolase (TIGR01509 family)
MLNFLPRSVPPMDELPHASRLSARSNCPRGPVRAVCFDLDGLIFNTEELYPRVMRELLQRRKKEFTWELIDQMMGRPGRVALQIMIDHQRLDDIVDALYAESDEIFYEIWNRELALMPGLSELLETLEMHGIPKAIGTSSRPHIVEKMLARFELGPRFEFVLTSADVVQGKPHPEIYLKAAERFGVSPGEMMVLEDSENGSMAAAAAGTIAVAVPGSHNRNRQKFDHCELVANTLADPRIYALLGLDRAG